MKIIAYLAAAILIFFGVLFVWGTFSPEGQIGWLFIGAVSIAAGFIIIFFISRKAQKESGQAGQNVTLKIDLPGNVSMDTIKCKSCGGTLAPENIQMVAGAPVVTCPFCNTTYQLTEEPKW